MSRVGKKPVPIPKGVNVAVKAGAVHVKGPKGSLEFALPKGIQVAVDGQAAKVSRGAETRSLRAMHGMARALIQNMVTGVSEGFVKRLTIVGVGYSAKLEGRNLVLNIGFCHPVTLPIPKGIEVELPPRTNTMILTGPDRQQVGQFAADIRRIRPPEPYKGKGIRYEDEAVRRKAGKSVVGGAK